MENATTVRDWRGRSYLVGPVPADRTRMFRLALAAMAAIGPLQYGFAALLATDANGLILLAACIVFQAVGALPTLRLVRRGRLPVRAALAAGAALTTLGLLTAAVVGAGTGTAAFPLALLGYAVLGGLGAGAVYGVCGEVVSSWYPDRPAARVSMVTGAFGYGSAPLLVWAGLAPAMTPAVFAVAALLAAAAIGTAARSLRLAPEGWWPETVEPRAHALEAARLRRTPGAVRQFGLAQALRTRALPALAVILACAGAVSVFDVVVVASTGAWGALALMVALNGGGRAVAMRLSEFFGRRLVLASVLGLLAVGQVLLAGAMNPTARPAGGVAGLPPEAANAAALDAGAAPGTGAALDAGAVLGVAAGSPLLWLGAIAAGLGGGAFYPLVASLVREFFGERQTCEIHAVVYSAKAVAGVLGVAMAAYALTAPATALLLAAGLAALPALASTRLRTPGLPATIPL
ncbi:hypothetical protein [Nonomuraea ferruginea]|uniref:MFS transporter n=1 Tax=Nonomuraea ferruginea TaxID=46174 RepID=A0ABT4SPG2_9ACTN|nr:hypothetical protein [Nonomuraea ferruginea]MDA0639132.1 hypothetical protein [Nonomuraea ferruginea]